MLFGVQNVVCQTGAGEHIRHQLGVFDAGGAHQDGLTFGMTLFNIGHHSFKFFFSGAKYLIVEVFADHRPVGGDDHGFQAVDALELVGFGVGGAGHAGEFAVEAEVVLEGNGGQGLVFLADFHAFFGFHGLMQAFRPTAAGHQAAGEFVHNHDFAVLHHIVFVQVKQAVGAQSGHQVVHQGDIGGGIKRISFLQQAHFGEDLLGMFMAGFAEQYGAVFLIHPIIALALFFFLAHQLGGHFIHHQIQIGVVVGLAGDNERGTGFVDQNGVHFVHHREVQLALHLVAQLVHHIVAQVVEAEFVIRAVGDVGVIGFVFGGLIHIGHNHAHFHAEEVVERAHDIGIAGGEVVVYRYHMHAFTGERVQIHCQRSHQGFALAGSHFGDFALVQHHAADELHIKMAHAQCAAGSFAAHGKSFFQNVVQGFALGEPLFEFCGFGLQRRIVELLDVFFHAVDAYHGFAVLFQKPVVAAAEHFLGQ